MFHGNCPQPNHNILCQKFVTFEKKSVLTKLVLGFEGNKKDSKTAIFFQTLLAPTIGIEPIICPLGVMAKPC
jgi:hypothetical protein